MANALAALEAGVTEFDASIGGLGGSPFAPGGATATWRRRTWWHMLADMGIETGVDVEAVARSGSACRRSWWATTFPDTSTRTARDGHPAARAKPTDI